MLNYFLVFLFIYLLEFGVINFQVSRGEFVFIPTFRCIELIYKTNSHLVSFDCVYFILAYIQSVLGKL